jgi:hypothetical protein
VLGGLPNDTAVVTTFFNPLGYSSRMTNLIAFLARMRRHGIPVQVAEVAFGEAPFALTGLDHVLQFRAQSVLWHKEALIGQMARRLPDRYVKIAWVDADVLFDSPLWLVHASELLERFPLAQLFEEVRHLGPSGVEWRRSRGVAASRTRGELEAFRFDRSNTWPGLAWAARRELLTGVGLLDTLVVGGADTYLSLAAYGEASEWHLRLLPPGLAGCYERWHSAFFEEVAGQVGVVPVTAVQLGHGSPAARGYVDRFRILRDFAFDPPRDLIRRDDGLLEWAEPESGLATAVRGYFEGRREDE